MIKKFALLATAFAGMHAGVAGADTCVGNCGTASPNGVVTAPPAYGPTYQYISTFGGTTGVGQIASVGGGASNATGSLFTTSAFTANAGDTLNFFFNYVTSDGSGKYSDYTFAELLKDGAHAAWLFTARTTTTGNTSPGFGLPANDSVLTPSTSGIIAGAPVWAQLGTSSGSCFAGGCGYTGWIGSKYAITSTGSYQLKLGVTNFGDAAQDSGLAFAGITLNNAPVNGAVPEPATWAMMILGLGAVGYAIRRRKVAVAQAA
jgi:hypothetical protein